MGWFVETSTQDTTSFDDKNQVVHKNIILSYKVHFL